MNGRETTGKYKIFNAWDPEEKTEDAERMGFEAEIGPQQTAQTVIAPNARPMIPNQEVADELTGRMYRGSAELKSQLVSTGRLATS